MNHDLYTDADADTAVMTPPSNLALADLGFTDIDPADAARAWVLDCALRDLPVPKERTEDLRYHRFLDDLARGDGLAAADQLVDGTGTAAAGAFALLPCYVAATLAVEAFNEVDYSLAGGGQLLRCIRQQVRDELLRLPAQSTVEWIVPATPDDRTAAHVGALVFARKGTVARPWLWSVIPDQGRFTIVGAEADSHAAARHPRCHACVPFAAIARRLVRQP